MRRTYRVSSLRWAPNVCWLRAHRAASCAGVATALLASAIWLQGEMTPPFFLTDHGIPLSRVLLLLLVAIEPIAAYDNIQSWRLPTGRDLRMRRALWTCAWAAYPIAGLAVIRDASVLDCAVMMGSTAASLAFLSRGLDIACAVGGSGGLILFLTYNVQPSRVTNMVVLTACALSLAGVLALHAVADLQGRSG